MTKPRIFSFRPSTPELAEAIDAEAAATGQPVSTVLDRVAEFALIGALSADDVVALRDAVLDTRHPCPRCGRVTDTAPAPVARCRPCGDRCAGYSDESNDRADLARIMGWRAGHLVEAEFVVAARAAGLFCRYDEIPEPPATAPTRAWAHVDVESLAALWDDRHRVDVTPTPRPATPAERRAEQERTAAMRADEADRRRREHLGRLRRDRAALDARIRAAEAEAEAEAELDSR